MDDRDDVRDDPTAHPDEPGAYIGHEPERAADTIPGGVRPDDERIAAHSTQAGPVDGEARPTPSGHRPGERPGDDRRREAGQDR
ncbi:MAG: hypothetical protein ACJ761_03645 [Chloroflexota bacterium]